MRISERVDNAIRAMAELAARERGEVILGVLGCPNLSNPDGSTGAIFAATDSRFHDQVIEAVQAILT